MFQPLRAYIPKVRRFYSRHVRASSGNKIPGSAVCSGMYREHTNVVRLCPGGSSGTEMPIEPDRYISTRKAPNLETQTNSKKFEEIFVAHLDAAYDLAHWLTRDKRNAEDVVQEACLRAF